MRPRLRHLVGLAAMLVAPLLSAGATAEDFERAQRSFPRVRAAFSHAEADWRERFREAGAAWPPRGLFVRAFKLEAELEIWASPRRGGARVRVASLPVCAGSGTLGLKRREGDGQVPEGFYRIDRFNPRSSFHLSLGLDYPNRWDRARASRDDLKPGGDIFIHGGCATIGCLPLGDPAIEGLYVVAVKARRQGQRQIPVEIHPCRFGAPACEAAVAGAEPDPDTQHAWAALRRAQRNLDALGAPLEIKVRADGYRAATPP
jgi:murein L,D-transpeptidase YafK